MSRMGDVKYLVNLGDQMSVSNRSSYFNIAFNVLSLTISFVTMVIVAVVLTNVTSEMHDNAIKGEKLVKENKSMNQANEQDSGAVKDTLNQLITELQTMNTTLNMKLKNLHQSIEKITFLENLLISSNNVVNFCSVGLKDGRVRDEDITASSIWSNAEKASNGRLDFQYSSSPLNYATWAASRNAAGQWIQVDLTNSTRVTGVVTQGRGDTFHDQWVTSYKVSYGNSSLSLQTIKSSNGNDKIFPGNNNRNSYVINRFPNPITARFFRIIVQTWHNHVSLRFDLITC